MHAHTHTRLRQAGCAWSPSPTNTLAVAWPRPERKAGCASPHGGAGEAERRLLGRAEPLNPAIWKILIYGRGMNLFGFRPTPGPIPAVRNAMASHQPKAEMPERWGQLCATWEVCFKSGSKNYIIQKKKITYFQGTSTVNARINVWPL